MTDDQILDGFKNLQDVMLTGFAMCATKTDLERFPTKADLAHELERFATKAELAHELERFATKADLERFATKIDLLGFEHRVLRRFDERDVRIDDHERRISTLEASS